MDDIDWVHMNAKEYFPALASILQFEIEALATPPAYHSDTAYTARRTVHTTIRNGQIKDEGEKAAPLRSPISMAYEAIESARTLREVIAGDACIVWRMKPEITKDGLYMRLCFESLSQTVPHTGEF